MAPKAAASAPTTSTPAATRGSGVVTTRKGGRRPRLTPEDYLERAMRAETPGKRARWASRGLGLAVPIDTTTQAMLLRQLYMARYARKHFEEAYRIADQAAALDVLPDVMHQDAARAKQALGDTDGAVGHLRLAARLGPPSRRAFHWWTLGSVLFLAGRHEEAVAALKRAARWGTSDKPLYQGHLALAKCGAGRRVRGLDGLIHRLASCPAGQGYGRFVLGQLSFQRGHYDEARGYLEAFIARTAAGRRSMAIALAGEVAMAQATLDQIASGRHEGPASA